MIPLTNEKQFFLDSMKEAQEKGVAYQDLGGDDFVGRTIRMHDSDVLNFANCSYLGLETHPKIKQGIIEATQNHGSLLSNSRSYFSSALYSELEKLLAQIFPGYQVVTTTTTLGHCSALPILIEPEDVIIIDHHVHNSVRMAARLCMANGTKVEKCRHNDMNYLETLVKRYKSSGARNIWFMADGVYSMQGNFLKIDELTELLDKYDQLHTYIDDAHGMSWTGKHGAGFILGRHNIHPKMIVAVSMCKSFAAFGGIIIFPNKDWADRVRFLGQSLIFSAPISPPILGAAIESAKIHLSDTLPPLQNELMNRILYFRERSQQLNLPLRTIDETPIQFIEIGESPTVYRVNQKLLDNDIFVTSAVFPAMPKKHGGIRVSITNHLTLADLNKLINLLDEVDISKYRDVQAHSTRAEEKSTVTAKS